MSSLKVLLDKNNSRDFLKKALELQYPNKINIAAFSRRANFSSRSFLSLYLAGKKGLSLESLNKIKAALKIPTPYKRYYFLLVAQEQQEIALSMKLKQRPSIEIKNLREEILKQEKAKSSVRSPSIVANKRELFIVFASLGEEKEGASLEEIKKKCQLNEKNILESLKVFQNEGLVKILNDRYYVTSAKVDLFQLKAHELLALMKEVSSYIHKNSEKILQSEDNLMLYFAFSMNSYQEKEFKERLRELVTEAIDSFQVDGGNCVKQLFLSTQS